MKTASSSQVSKSDPSYQAFVARLQARFEKNVAEHKHLFVTDVGVWEEYLAGFWSAAQRQYHNCNCCKAFMRKYGNLVVVTERGIEPAIWSLDDAIGTNQQIPVGTVIGALEGAKILGVFYSDEKEWGRKESGGWDHLAITPPASVRHKSVVDTAGQAMAKKREDHKNLRVAMSEYRRDLVQKVVDVLRSDTLYRNDKLLGPAEFFLSLYDVTKPWEFWLKVAGAPDGFCHPKSSMFGTLLDDFKAGMSYDVVKSRFESKMHPLRYQRPQAAPTESNIKRAEEIAGKLNLGPALARRIAKLSDVRLLWSPNVEQPKGDGVFGHLKPKGAESVVAVGSKKMTWVRFVAEVLPSAKNIEVYASGMQPWYVFTTAVNPDAVPIFQWDSEADRNPVAWYTRPGGTSYSNYGLSGGWKKVSGVSLFPNTWTSPAKDDRAIFFVEGAREQRSGGLALFPECMRTELREVRSVIEAHSRSGEMQGLREGDAVGIIVGEGVDVGLSVRVVTGLVSTIYDIDRWN